MVELLLVTLFGLCIGSFLNVAICRLPKHESIYLPASHCPVCRHSLKWYHNIPLLSWIFLKGKCAFCHTPISWQYPLIELLCAAFFAYFYAFTPDTKDALLLALIFSLLLSLSVIDLCYKAVPDALSLPALFCSFALFSPLESLQHGLLFMGAFSLLRFTLSAITQKEAMGEADIIIAGIIGAMLGIKLGCIAIYIAAVFALLVFVMLRNRNISLPFIPFLAMGLLITTLCDTTILRIMERLYE